MTELILTRGIPASGKTTWAKGFADAYGYVRVNRDELRKELHLAHGDDEVLVTKIQHSRVKALLENGMNVIVDDTNLKARFVKEWMRLAQAAGAVMAFNDFEIDLPTAIARDEGRFDGHVGQQVVKSFYDRYTTKGKLPAVPTIEEVVKPSFAPYVRQDDLPSAILVDIDGTLAHMEGRSPYDPTLYHTDSFDWVVAAIVERYAWDHDVEIIVLSGRDEKYVGETASWLRKHGFWFHQMYMRPEGDTRNDAIVKDELFEQHVAGKFNVDFVLDDRNRVVDMWRAKGLKVLQVADGDF